MHTLTRPLAAALLAVLPFAATVACAATAAPHGGPVYRPDNAAASMPWQHLPLRATHRVRLPVPLMQRHAGVARAHAGCMICHMHTANRPSSTTPRRR